MKTYQSFTALVMLAMRCVWMLRPGMLTCVLFWIAAFIWVLCNLRIRHGREVLPWIGMAAGFASNCVVTLANAGFMPVAVEYHPTGGSLWRAADVHSRLLALSDCHAGASSVGDWLIYSSALLSVALTIAAAIKRARTPSPCVTVPDGYVVVISEGGNS